MSPGKILALLLSSLQIVYTSGFDPDLVLEFFRRKEVGSVTAILCDGLNNAALSKKLSQLEIQSNFFGNLEGKFDLIDVVHQANSKMSGIVVDMECTPNSLLEQASKEHYFDLTRHWLIFPKTPFSREEFEFASAQLPVPSLNISEYLSEGVENMTNGFIMEKFNQDFNQHILNESYDDLDDPSTNIDPELRIYLELQAIVDSEVILAVKGADDYSLYEVHRKTKFTRMLIEQVGSMRRDGNSVSLEMPERLSTSAVTKRKDFGRAIVKAAALTQELEYFSKSDELTAKKFDYWAMKGLQMSKLVEENFNMRLLVKCFDDTSILKYILDEKTDMTANGLLLNDEGMQSLTYITNFFKSKYGLVYKEPALAQVANVYYRSFSAEVWCSVLAGMVASSALLYFQLRMLDKYEYNDGISMNGKDIFTFFTGAAFQQGSDIVSTTMSARTTMVVFLFASLFIFTSYTANIVALLQSTSDSIHNIHDFISSTFEMGFEDQAHERNLVENDENPSIKELFATKLQSKILDGNAYYNASYGMEKVQKELFAFHVELSTAGTIIRNTFEETDKCRLKMLQLFTVRYSGMAVPKNSPYKEILAQAYRWYQEVGLLHRTDLRYGSDLPKCWSRTGGGFSSIGLTEVSYIITIMIYGLVGSVILLLLEKIHCICFRRQQVKLIQKCQYNIPPATVA